MLSGHMENLTCLADLAADGRRKLLRDLRLGANYLAGSLNRTSVAGSTIWVKFIQDPRYYDHSNTFCAKYKTGSKWMSRSGSFDIQSCFKGTYRQRDTAETLGECKSCKDGHLCDWASFSEGLGSPRPCPEGTYLNESRADAVSECEPISFCLCTYDQ